MQGSDDLPPEPITIFHLARSVTLTEGEWHDFKVILDEDIVVFYIDGQIVGSAEGSYGNIFENGRCRIQGYNTTISVKLDNLENDTETVYKYDFEFQKASSVNGFTAQNGSVSYQDGRLIYNIQGAVPLWRRLCFKPRQAANILPFCLLETLFSYE